MLLRVGLSGKVTGIRLQTKVSSSNLGVIKKSIRRGEPHGSTKPSTSD